MEKPIVIPDTIDIRRIKETYRLPTDSNGILVILGCVACLKSDNGDSKYGVIKTLYYLKHSGSWDSVMLIPMCEILYQDNTSRMYKCSDITVI